jgi:glucosamine--fructose-6-phosphate aminotransferase (isomerizing)
MQEMLGKLRQLRAEMLVITDQSNSEAIEIAGRSAVYLPSSLEEAGGKLPIDVWTPIPYIIPAQLFAARLAEHKGLDPDSPRTLSKVTLTM